MLAVALLGSLSTTVHAQVATGGAALDPSASADHLGGTHILRVDDHGNLVCDEAAEEQLAAFRQVHRQVNLTPLPSLNPPEQLGGLRIILRATDQLLERPEALLAFRRAAARWERMITTPITTVIDVDYGPERFGSGPFPANVLASASSALYFSGLDPAGTVAQLQASTSDEQLLQLYDAIPLPTPSTLNLTETDTTYLGQGIGGLIPLQALGVFPDSISADPSVNAFGNVPNIGFNSAFPYDFNSVDGIDPNRTDFEAVVLHEIGHTLGFVTAIGFGQPYFMPWDLFRVRPDAVTPGEDLTDGEGFEDALRVITPGPPNTDTLVVENGTVYYEPVQTFFDGLAEYETSTATGARAGGDGNQGSHWRDNSLRPPSSDDPDTPEDERYIGIMDPNFGAGEDRRPYPFYSDLRMLEVIGYSINYDPTFAQVALSLAGQGFDADFLVDEVDLGNVATGGTRSIPFIISNESDENTLAYEIAELEIEAAFPDGAGEDVSLSLSATEGTVAPGSVQVLSLDVTGSSEPAFVAGYMIVRTNDRDRLVIEVPFVLSVGGATEPSAAVAYGLPAGGDLGNLGEDEERSFNVSLSNRGSLPLDYEVVTAIAERPIPFVTVPPAEGRGMKALADLFVADFEDPADFSQFAGVIGDSLWYVTDEGPAALEGHSTPNAAYFGHITTTVDTTIFEYANDRFGALVTPNFDLSSYTTSDVLRLRFAHYLSAEEGYDFASVAYSVDGGATFTEVATSDGGILQNTEVWETITIDVPGVAGAEESVLFAFLFETDGSVTDMGWFLDDITITVEEDAAPIYASPFAGEVGGGTTEEIAVTINAANIPLGFYRGAVQVLAGQRGDNPPPATFTFSVGDPDFPTVTTDSDLSVMVIEGDEGIEGSIDVTNGGDAPLAYVRLLEPALSAFDPAVPVRKNPASILNETMALPEMSSATLKAPAEKTVASEGGSVDILNSISLGAQLLLFDVTQLPDSSVAVVSGGSPSLTQVVLLDPELSEVLAVYSGSLGGQATGLTYDTNNGTFWLTIFQTGSLLEVELDTENEALVPTGAVISLGFAPFGLSYSSELDAFAVGLYNSVGVTLVDRMGRTAPGFPTVVDGRAYNDVPVTGLPVVSFSRGVLEMSSSQNQLVGHDQFGNAFPAADTTVLSDTELAGSTGLYGGIRSVVDPNGSFYVTARPSEVDAQARVFRFDPADLPEYVEAPRVLPAEPFFANGLPVAEAMTVPFSVTTGDLTPGTYTEDIALLVNNPTAPVVRLPLTIEVAERVGMDELGSGRFALLGSSPNPFRTTARLEFELPEALDVTAEVFNVLGQRVRTLANEQTMAAGPASLLFEGAGLAPGVYFVRISAGSYHGTEKVVLLR